MKTIGITGGSALYELGSAMEVQFFFDCLDAYVVQKQLAIDWQILTDRFYKRYLRQAELEPAIRKMLNVNNLFKLIPNPGIDLSDVDFGAGGTKLKRHGGTLAEVFEVFFEGFDHCAESAKLNFEAFKDYAGYQYEPVRLVVADQPWFMVEKNRPLGDYDSLEGKPFWLLN